jgi:hypothetical protein
MTNENQKPATPGAHVEPAKCPVPQQTQGDAKPATEKPAGQQK